MVFDTRSELFSQPLQLPSRYTGIHGPIVVDREGWTYKGKMGKAFADMCRMERINAKQLLFVLRFIGRLLCPVAECLLTCQVPLWQAGVASAGTCRDTHEASSQHRKSIFQTTFRHGG